MAPGAKRGRSDKGLEGFFNPAPPRVLAHRGLAVDAPENTLLAFAKALAVGVIHLETDVHASADGVAVIAHDETLERVAGRKVRVDQLTMAELRRVDLGEGQGFCSLAEALDAFGEARFNIDLKSPASVQPAVEAIRDHRAIDRVLIASFSDRRRRAALAQLPGAATSLSSGSMKRLILADKARLGSSVRRTLAEADAIQIPERVKGVRILTPRLIDAAHDAGAEVHVWTINEPSEMVRLLDLGVDGIVTDRADLAMTVLESRS